MTTDLEDRLNDQLSETLHRLADDAPVPTAWSELSNTKVRHARRPTVSATTRRRFAVSGVVGIAACLLIATGIFINARPGTSNEARPAASPETATGTVPSDGIGGHWDPNGPRLTDQQFAWIMAAMTMPNGQTAYLPRAWPNGDTDGMKLEDHWRVTGVSVVKIDSATFHRELLPQLRMNPSGRGFQPVTSTEHQITVAVARTSPDGSVPVCSAQVKSNCSFPSLDVVWTFPDGATTPNRLALFSAGPGGNTLDGFGPVGQWTPGVWPSPTTQPGAPIPPTSSPTTPTTEPDASVSAAQAMYSMDSLWDPAGPRLADAELARVLKPVVQPDGTVIAQFVHDEFHLSEHYRATGISLVQTTFAEATAPALYEGWDPGPTQQLPQQNLKVNQLLQSAQVRSTPVWLMVLHFSGLCGDADCTSSSQYPEATLAAVMAVDGSPFGQSTEMPLVIRSASGDQSANLASLGQVGQWTWPTD